MCFLYSENDTASKGSAEYFFNTLLKANVSKPKLTFNYPIKGANKLTGAALLNVENGTKADELVDKFIEAVIQAKGAAPVVKRDFKQPYLVPLDKFGVKVN
jgi:hypothetical protein